MNSPSIEAVNLSKRYGSFPALSNLNLRIEGSKCVGFLGPNGAGKTTTLKIFTDMIRASEGRALINGIEVHPNKKKALESAGALIESPEIYPSLTPREALSMVAELRGLPKGERRKTIEDAVAEVKMDEWLDNAIGPHLEATEAYFRAKIVRKTIEEVAAEYSTRDILGVVLDWDDHTVSGRGWLGNDWLAGLSERYPGVLMGFGSVDPHKPDARDELRRVADLGLRGLKFHPSTLWKRPSASFGISTSQLERPALCRHAVATAP